MEYKQRFEIYKGLQMPLVFKSFKGKYIYWAVFLVVGSFVLSALTAIFIGFAVALPLALVLCGGGMFFIYSKQKKGQHQKSNKKGIFIQQANPISSHRDFIK